MASDICYLHFRIDDSTLSATSAPTISNNNTGNSRSGNDKDDTNTVPLSLDRQGLTVAKVGLHEWLCQLSILDDEATIRGLLGPLVDPELKKAAALSSCCTLQVAKVSWDSNSLLTGAICSKARILFAKSIQSEDLFRQGVEFYVERQDVLVDWHFYEFTLILSSLHIKLLGPPNGLLETHALALSECDPVSRNVDPLVELMTQFQYHNPTTDVECCFVDHNGHVRTCVRAHQAILSIYPVFSEKMSQAQSNPYQRSKNTVIVLLLPVEIYTIFLRMLEFIYSGKLPTETYTPRNDHWKKAFDISKEYGLDRSPSSTPWMEWHLQELGQILTEENVLEIYFAWGYTHEGVAKLCVKHVNDRQCVQYQGQEFHLTVRNMIKARFLGKPGCREFQDAFVNRGWVTYANQQSQQRQRDLAMRSPTSQHGQAHQERQQFLLRQQRRP
ncbi:hypothetical protein FBU30_005744 [Linnemannia zychae]|nr:hypothetical protein FBU30_005744 [Linnemannia zychae]